PSSKQNNVLIQKEFLDELAKTIARRRSSIRSIITSFHVGRVGNAAVEVIYHPCYLIPVQLLFVSTVVQHQPTRYDDLHLAALRQSTRPKTASALAAIRNAAHFAAMGEFNDRTACAVICDHQYLTKLSHPLRDIQTQHASSNLENIIQDV
uniref:hypothetical protein n=1 Tax=Serratia marcescens TaxID=615 RepID=UPI001953F6E4